MKKKSIKNFIAQFACWIVLLQMMNVAIDPHDAHLQQYSIDQEKEDLSINETESIFELLAEGLFDTDIPETDEKDQDTSLPVFDYYCHHLPDNPIILPTFQLPHKPYHQGGFIEYYPPFDAPPPKTT